MKARIKPLDGKYYGTIIEFVDGRLVDNEIKIWIRSDDYDDPSMDPSSRELAQGEVSLEEHKRLYETDYYLTPVDISGGHYETVDSLRVAEAIVKALESLE